MITFRRPATRRVSNVLVRWVAMAMAIVAVPIIPRARAQVSAPAPHRDNMVTRVYDVRDLLGSVPDYPFPGLVAGAASSRSSAGGHGAAVAATASPKKGGDADREARRAQAEDQLVRLLTETVDRASWVDAVVRPLNGRLIVTQSEANHKALAEVFRQLRETNATMVRVRAHWLVLQPGEVETLYKQRPEGKPPQAPFPEIDRDALQKAGAKSGHYRAETVCFDAQTVHVTSGRSRRVITDVTAVVGTNSAAYEPASDTLNSGLVLQVTPLLNSAHSAAMLDINSSFAEFDPDAAAKGDAGAGLPLAADRAVDAGSAVDRVRSLTQELRTTVSVPLGRPVLIGGMTLDPSAKGGDSPQLYLVVEVTASEQAPQPQ
jgi:hypothetical protein